MPRATWVLLALASGLVRVAQADDQACPPKQFRWEEDCRELAGSSLSGLDQLRYLPLADDGSWWATLGGEYRLKVEGLHPPSFGLLGDEGYTATGQRFLLHADLRSAAGPRLFVQLSGATDTGRKPAERPFDSGHLDLAQGFVDVPFDLGAVGVTARVGRQELDLGGNRLVSNRDVTNLRRNFNLALVKATYDRWLVEAFAGHPVRMREGTFDDDNTPGETFWGARTRWTSASGAAVEAFALERSRSLAIYQGAVGPELRRTFGARTSGRYGAFDYTIQASIQRGTVNDLEIGAYGWALDLGYQLASPWTPRLGISSALASGGNTAADRRVRTFDTLYPNLGYFTDAPLIYPGNDWDLQPNIRVEPLRLVSVQAGVDFLNRVSKYDAVYELPGFPLIRGTGSGGNFIAALSYLKASWQANRYCSFSVSYVHASAGSLVRDALGRDTNYLMAQFDVKL